MPYKGSNDKKLLFHCVCDVHMQVCMCSWVLFVVVSFLRCWLSEVESLSGVWDSLTGLGWLAEW